MNEQCIERNSKQAFYVLFLGPHQTLFLNDRHFCNLGRIFKVRLFKSLLFSLVLLFTDFAVQA